MLRAVIAGASRRWILGEPADPGRASPVRERRPGGPLAASLCTPFAALSFVASSFAAFVGVTFLFGWVAGLLLVLKAWHLVNVTGLVVFSGAGYVTLMLVPVLCGFSCTRVAGRLVSRGWGGGPLRFLALGVCGLVAGMMAI
jgi:hypothetical protein